MPISIEPANPTTDTVVTFTFTGGSPCPDPTQTIEGSEFIFEVPDLTSGPCLSAPIPYELTWEVGVLDAGDYRITHDNPRMEEPETQSFVVVEGSAPPIPEAIPATGLVAALVLAMALALIAGRLLVHRRANTP